MKFVTIFITVMFGFNAMAMASPTCLTYSPKVKDQQLILNYANSGQTVYFIKNTYRKPLLLNHEEAHPSASAGWMSQLEPGLWSAILLSIPNFNLSCSLDTPGNPQKVNCKKVLKICRSPVKFKEKQSGNFWVIENKPWDQLVRGVKERLEQ